MWLIIYLLFQGQGKGETKGEDIIHHNLLRGGEATHNHLNTTIEGKEQFYYYRDSYRILQDFFVGGGGT